MTILIRGRQSVGERSAKGRQWSAKGRQSVGERTAIDRRKVGKGRQIFSDHIAIESTIIAEYSLIQFVPDKIEIDLFATTEDTCLLLFGPHMTFALYMNRIIY